MTEGTFKAITELSDEEIEKLSHFIATAMEKDPAFKAMVGTNRDFGRELVSAMLRATLLEGKAYGVEVEGEIATIVLFFRYPATLFGSEAQRELGYNQFFQKLSPTHQAWWLTTYPETMTRESRKLYTPEENERMWYCKLFATKPSMQGRGYGSHVMAAFYQQVRQAWELLALVTANEDNVAKYVSMGFRERGRAVMKSPNVDDPPFPVIWMSRE